MKYETHLNNLLMRPSHVILVLHLLVIGAFAGTVSVGNWEWLFEDSASTSYILADISSVPYSNLEAVDGWFYFYVDSQTIPYGGVRSR